MKKLEFVDRDFNYCLDSAQAKERAQAKYDAWLKELLDEAEVVYSATPTGKNYSNWSSVPSIADERQGVLINIKKLEKVCLKHEPNMYLSDSKGYHYCCKHCGVDLEPTGWVKK